MSDASTTRRAWQPAALVAYAMLFGIISIAGRDLCGHDDPRVAGIARSMALTGKFAVPYLNGRPFLEFPSLGYVPIALGLLPFKAPSDTFALLPIVLLGVATVWLTYRTGKILGGRGAGLAAGLFLVTLVGFRDLHARCLADPGLLFFVTLSLYGFAAGEAAPRRAFAWFTLFYLGAAAGFLAKGLVGTAVPVAVAGAYVLLRRDFALLRKMRPHFGILVLAAPFGLWILAARREAGTGAVREFFRQSLFRFASDEAAHSEPVYHYITPILAFSLPALLVLLAAAWLRFGPAKKRGLFGGRAAVFPAFWFAVTFIGLSAASAKRYIYMGPMYPPVALLAGLCWIRLVEAYPRLRRAGTIAIAAGVVVFAVLQFAIVLPDENSTSMRAAFDRVKAEQRGENVLVFGRKESLRGAAVFYLGRNCPEALDVRRFREILTDERKDWVVVAMYNRKDGLFPDGLPPPPRLTLLYERALAGRHTICVFRRPGI